MPKGDYRVPPGPRGLSLLRATLELTRDPLGVFSRAASEFGDIVLIPFPWNHRLLLSNPDDIEQVFVLDQHKFHKGIILKEAGKHLLGNGLLTSEGEFWRRQRRLAQPAFHRPRIATYATTMVEFANLHLQSWHDGEVRDLAAEMKDLTAAIAVKTLFGVELKSEALGVSQALKLITRQEFRRLRSPLRMRWRRSNEAQKRLDEAYSHLNSIVFRIIEDRRERAAQGDDLLSMLMNAVDEDGGRMSPKQLRDEVMTLFLAGHETTALALAWSWFLLAENPRTELCLHEELARFLAGRLPTLDDLEHLPYLNAVIQESLRLYPPAYAVGRTAIEPFQIKGYFFPAGLTVLAMQWVVHRSPRYFEKPDVFLPERWLDGLAERLPHYAYFPFGGGPRRCIGQGFALMEAALILATIAQRYRFRLLPEQRVVPDPLVTLNAKYGIRMTLQERRPQP